MSIQQMSIQFMRGRSEDWYRENIILLAGELGIETDTGKYKIGNGLTSWRGLSYSGGAFPNDDDIVYVLRNNEYTPANVVDMSETWQPSINGEDIVLAVDEDMTPYQLSGSNTEVNV